MKTRLLVSLAVLFTAVAATAHGQTSYEYAPVLEANPVYQLVERSEPVRQCWEEEVAVDHYQGGRQSHTPLLVSTIIGGAIGNAVGHGKSNKRVGAVLGAMLGHSIGRDIIREGSGPVVREYQTVERCETVYQQFEEERLVGYQVTYLYDGQEYTVRMNSDPGEQIRVRVNVQPIL